jgi:hypothetical protein
MLEVKTKKIMWSQECYRLLAIIWYFAFRMIPSPFAKMVFHGRFSINILLLIIIFVLILRNLIEIYIFIEIVNH